MRSVIRPRAHSLNLRSGLFVLALCLTGGLTVASASLVGSGTASAAVQGSKTRITTSNCSTATCQITLTIKGIVKETPTGQVNFLITGAGAPSTGDSCLDSPMISINGSSARATCDATGLPAGHDDVRANYSGDTNFDPSSTSKRITVRNPPPS